VTTAGLILAAGESRRMGAPKALLAYHGSTFLETLVRLFAKRCSPVIVVLGAGAEEIQRSVGQVVNLRRVANPPPGAHETAALAPVGNRRAGWQPAPQSVFVVNPDYALGQFSSMQCGLRAAPSEVGGVLFTLVDHPAVSEATVDALLNGVDGPALLRVPRYGGRRGHPIWFSSELIPEFLKAPVGSSARDVVQRHEAETDFIDVDDDGVLADIDDPDAYRSLIGAAS